jgi:hypothetical protein
MGRKLLMGCGRGGAAAFTPTDVSGLSLWLDFDDAATLFQLSNGTTAVASDADPIGYATDKSGSGRHHTQGTAASRLTFKAAVQNGKNAALLDGVDDFLRPAVSLAALTAATAFLVVRAAADPAGAAGTSGLWEYSDVQATHFPFTDGVVYDGFGSTVRKTTGNPTTTLAQWNVYGIVSKANEWTSRINGVQHFTTATNTVGWGTAATNALGVSESAGSTYYLSGHVGELIVYDSELSAANRQAVEAYLMAKWGIV